MKKIWIDAGHGGSDPGSCNGQYQEKTYALGIALKLGEILSGRGYTVKYTRNGDSFISLGARCQDANAWGADLFLSVHHNSAANTSANGIETLCYSLSSKAGKLAQAIQPLLIKATGMNDRGVKERPGLAVLRGTKMPAVLVEAGFICNHNDLQRITTVEFRDQVAGAIADGVDAYLGKNVSESVSKGKESALTTPNDIVWELSRRGIVTDATGMLQDMEENPNGRLYWLARKCVKYMQEKGI